MKKIIFLMLCIVLTSGCANNIDDKGSSKLENNIEFCNKMSIKTQELKSLNLPNAYIEQSQNKEFLKIWKDYFIQYNQITEEYFNNHIRIESDSIIDVPHLNNPDWVNDPNPNKDKYLQINYFFIIDWVNIPMKGGFLIKNQDSDEYFSFNEIKNNIDRYINIPDRTKTDIGIAWEIDIDYIRNHEDKKDINELKNHGKIVDTIISCEDAIKTLTKKEKTLIPNQIGFYRDFVIRARGNIDNKVCPQASISLTSGKIIDYYDQPCMIT